MSSFHQTNGFMVYVINLARSPERLASITARLEQLGLQWQRIEAVDGKTLGHGPWRDFDASRFERCHGMTPLANELGCYLSHLKVFDAIAQSEVTHALVLEDDAGLNDELPEVLTALIAASADWDMVKLSKVHRGSPLAVKTLTTGHTLNVMRTRCTGSSAYMVNRHAASVFQSALRPMWLPYDHAFARGWDHGLKIRLVEPNPCQHDTGVPTTLGDSSVWRARKFPWYRRLATYTFRLSDDWNRWFHARSESRLTNLSAHKK